MVRYRAHAGSWPSRLACLLGLGLLQLACGRTPAVSPAVFFGGPGEAAHSTHGMVVSGAPLATAVGVSLLEEGANAVDAAVATAFALAVVEPSQSGIGGRTQLLLRTADGRLAAIDGTTEVPAAWTGGPVDDEDAWGYSTIAVPGTVAALARALRLYGTWPLDRVLGPAIELAERGFELSAEEAGRIGRAADRLAEVPGSRMYFLRPDGSPLAPGDTLRQPDLAAVLRLIAAGGEQAFYGGEVGRRMAADFAANGGLVTGDDLLAYRAEDSIIGRGLYRGYELVGSYLPASGITTIEILQILDHLDLASPVGTADWVALVAQALLIGFEDRVADAGPPEEKVSWLTSRTLAAERARRIALPPGAAGPGLPPAPAEPPATAASSAGPVGTPDREPEFTTHVSVADRDGAVVALTQSVGPLMGSKVVTPGLGFVHAATMGYLGELEPGTRRHWSSQSPLLVLRKGRPVFVLGAAGSRRIISGIVETVSRAIDQGLPLDQAMAAPRFHPTPDRIDMEQRPGTAWGIDALARLRELGFRVETRDDAPYFARLNAIAWDTVRDEWVGVTDARWQGAAGAARR